MSSATLNLETPTSSITLYRKAFFWLLIVLAPFQDSGLQNTSLKFLGASPAFLPALAYLALTLSDPTVWQTRLRDLKTLAAIIAYAAVGSLLYLAFSTKTGGYSTGTIATKAFNYLVLLSLYLGPILLPPGDMNLYKRPLRFAFIIALAGYGLVDMLTLAAFDVPSLFHATPAVTSPRGFSLELSTFGATIAVLGLLNAAADPQRRWVYLAITAVIVVVSLSKGTVLAAGLAAVVSVLLVARLSLLSRTAILGAIVAMAMLVNQGLLEKFSYDYESGTSQSTRGTFSLAALMATANYPLGVSPAGYLPILRDYLTSASGVLFNYGFTTESARELDSYLDAGNSRGLNVKAQFLEFLMIFGLPAALFLWLAHISLLRALRSTGDAVGMTLLLFVAFAQLTYMPGLGFYLFPIAYAYLRDTTTPRDKAADVQP